MEAQLQFRDVTLGYDRHPAVHHLSGEVARGALLAVIGPNGAGKSTLFRGLVGILKPLAGSISLDGLDVRDIAYLPQIADIDRSFPISVFDFVSTGLWRATGLFGGIGKSARDKIEHALAAVGLTGFENRGIGTQQRQRAGHGLNDLDGFRVLFLRVQGRGYPGKYKQAGENKQAGGANDQGELLSVNLSQEEPSGILYRQRKWCQSTL